MGIDVPGAGDLDPVARWACSGVMALTGHDDGAPLCPPPDGAVRLDNLAAALRASSSELGAPVDVAWGRELAGRAPLLGFRRRGRISANGTCRLLRMADGWAALSLPRPEDVGSIEALTGRAAGTDPWPVVEPWAAAAPVDELVDRARLLGLPAARLASVPSPGPWPWEVERPWPAGPVRPLGDLRVVDLSPMWAGPLAAKLLAAAGARVVKVESITRPDGARRTPAFFDWLHRPDQPGVVLDFADPDGRAALRALLDRADVVIEGSRPRALEQLGVGPSDLAPRPGRTWLSITGYGRRAPECEWVAFGDDAAVAGGLVARDADGEPVFCGDAIADPVTGMLGCLAVLGSLRRGGGEIVDLSMARAAAWVAGTPPTSPSPAARPGEKGGWEVATDRGAVAVADPVPFH